MDNLATDRHTPVPVSGLANVVSITAGYDHALALLSDGTVRAWGYDGDGELGDGTSVVDRTTPVAVSHLSNVVSITAGVNHSLALVSDGTVRAWGDNASGQLGDGTFTERTAPVVVPGLINIIALEAIDEASFALSADGRLWSWGRSTYGELGVGDFAKHVLPTEVLAPPGYRFTAIATDGPSLHMLALIAPVPEPSSFVLAAFGAIGLLALRRRHKGSAGDSDFSKPASLRPLLRSDSPLPDPILAI